MKKKFYVSDIREDLLLANMDKKRTLIAFGRFYAKEKDADDFIKLNPANIKYYCVLSENNNVVAINKT